MIRMVGNVNIPQYWFVIFNKPMSPMTDLKTILWDKKICSHKGEIVLYAPYSELLSAFNMKFPNEEMWGVGISTSALTNKAMLSDGLHPSKKPDGFKYGNLLGSKLYINELDLSEMKVENNDFFLVVPNLKAMDSVCYHGYVPGREKEGWKQWWCKGLRNDCCEGKNDVEINDYLNYYRFHRNNRIEMGEKDLFPNHNLFIAGALSHDYLLLDLTPEEMHNVVQIETDLFSCELF